MKRLLLSLVAAVCLVGQSLTINPVTGKLDVKGNEGKVNYVETVSGSGTTLSITAANHKQAHKALLVLCYTSTGDALVRVAYSGTPSSGQFAFHVDPTTFDVSIKFASGGNDAGWCAVNGSGQGVAGDTGPAGADGAQGADGADGDPACIAWADDASGTGFSTSTPKAYQASKALADCGAAVAGDFTGLWQKITGNNGAAGNPACVAWADASDGTGFSTSTPKPYQAVKTLADCGAAVQADFAGLWQKVVGNDGEQGPDGPSFEINTQTETTSKDDANDYAVIHSAAAGAIRRIKLVNLFSGLGGGGLPSQTGHANKILGTDGSAAAWQLVGFDNINATNEGINYRQFLVTGGSGDPKTLFFRHITPQDIFSSGTPFAIALIPTGTTSSTVSLGNHLHAGVYQPADADLDVWAGKTAPTGTVLGATDTQIVQNKQIDNTNRITGYIDLDEIATPGANPSAGRLRMYAKTTEEKICVLNPAGSELCMGSGSGSGDVTAASAFGADNRLIKSDGTGKGVQSTGIGVDDSNNMTGVTSIAIGGTCVWKDIAGVMVLRNVADTADCDIRVNSASISGSGYDERSEQTAPSTPAADKGYTWLDATDKTLKVKDEDGNESTTVRGAGTRDGVKVIGFIDQAGNPQAVTVVKGDVGLGNVDNTSDATKNSATATLTNKTLTLPIIGHYPVASLPAAGTAYRVAIVEDGLNAGDCGTGGGSTKVYCIDTGAVWVSLGAGLTSVTGSNGVDCDTVGNAVTCQPNPGIIKLLDSGGYLVTNFGSGAPASTDCDAAAEVGRIYARTDGAGAKSTLYVCGNTGASTYAWELYSGSGSGITTQDEGVQQGTSQTTFNFTGAGVTASSAGSTTTVNIPGGGSSIDPATTLMQSDDFGCGNFSTGTLGCLGWYLSASGFASASANTISGSPGTVTMTTSATINSVVGISPLAHQVGYNPAEMFTEKLKVASISGTSPSSSIRLRFGITTQYATPDAITNGIYLEKLEGDTNWFCVVRASAAETRVDTGVAFAVTEFALQVRRVNSTTAGCKVASKLSGLAGATEVTNNATQPTTDMNSFVMIKNTAAEVKLLNIDYYERTITGLNR